MYDAHIQLEEGQVFLLASRLLKRDQLQEIGEEMKQRRSLTARAGPGH
jgi:hemerythrin-like domain-containing protein